MNAHKSLGFLAAVLVTVAQIALFATDTAAVAQNESARGGYEQTLNARVAPAVTSESGATAVG